MVLFLEARLIDIRRTTVSTNFIPGVQEIIYNWYIHVLVFVLFTPIGPHSRTKLPSFRTFSAQNPADRYLLHLKKTWPSYMLRRGIVRTKSRLEKGPHIITYFWAISFHFYAIKCLTHLKGFTEAVLELFFNMERIFNSNVFITVYILNNGSSNNYESILGFNTSL